MKNGNETSTRFLRKLLEFQFFNYFFREIWLELYGTSYKTSRKQRKIEISLKVAREALENRVIFRGKCEIPASFETLLQ